MVSVIYHGIQCNEVFPKTRSWSNDFHVQNTQTCIKCRQYHWSHFRECQPIHKYTNGSRIISRNGGACTKHGIRLQTAVGQKRSFRSTGCRGFKYRERAPSAEAEMPFSVRELSFRNRAHFRCRRTRRFVEV